MCAPHQTIRNYIEPIRLAAKEVNAVVDERQAEWGHSAALLP